LFLRLTDILRNNKKEFIFKKLQLFQYLVEITGGSEYTPFATGLLSERRSRTLGRHFGIVSVGRWRKVTLHRRPPRCHGRSGHPPVFVGIHRRYVIRVRSGIAFRLAREASGKKNAFTKLKTNLRIFVKHFSKETPTDNKQMKIGEIRPKCLI